MNMFSAFEAFETELEIELQKDFKKFSNFYLSDKSEAIWSQDIWFDIEEIYFESISEAAEKLKKINSHWVGHSLSHHRRAQLIQEQLNFYKRPKLEFLGPIPKQNFGCFLMVDKNKIFASCKRRHPLPFGVVEFNENKSFPPSRAYLKLWEVMTLYGVRPSKHEVCLDLGSCPGGWSWVLSELGAQVISVDKAPLDKKISKIKNIRFLKKDAFELDPHEVGPVDWLFSDIICAPEKLFRLIEKWRNNGVKNFVCTIKFKGKTDFEIIKKFRALPGARLYHLYHNKHEITLVLQSP